MSKSLKISAAVVVIGGVLAGTAMYAAPSDAYTRYVCKYEQKRREHTGTVVGAITGGLIGNAVSGHNSKGLGTVVGAVGGAAIGSKMGHDSGKRACTQAAAYRTSVAYSTDSHGRRVKTVYRYVRE